MSTEVLSKLRSDALSLVKSLDLPADPDAREAWDVEIARRTVDIDAGTANLVDRAEFQRQMQARLGRP